jgi:hypothetical protein
MAQDGQIGVDPLAAAWRDPLTRCAVLREVVTDGMNLSLASCLGQFCAQRLDLRARYIGRQGR